MIFPFSFWKRSGTPPLAPSSLSATTISTSRIDLSWTDNSSNEVTFRIERQASPSSPFIEIGSVGANVTTYSDLTIANKAGYNYRVRARNAGGNSAYSNQSFAMTWMLGTDGDIVGESGDVVVFQSGVTYDYNTITINDGCDVYFGDGGSSPPIVGCKGAITIQDVVNISGQTFNGPGYSESRLAPDWTVVAYDSPQQFAGEGGSWHGISDGGQQSDGNAGGGASVYTNGGNADIDTSGPGAEGDTAGGASVGPDQDGLPGSDATDGAAGAGSGAGRAKHSVCGYVKSAGDSNISAFAVIDFSGEAGKIGGDGGNSSGFYGGSGGGGGAGGNGGFINWLSKTFSNGMPTANVSAGSSGIAGNAGEGAVLSGSQGFNGNSGLEGVQNFATY